MNTAGSRVTPTETRKLVAIMFTDMVGFSRQMSVDEARMLRLLDVHNQLIQAQMWTRRTIAAQDGSLIG